VQYVLAGWDGQFEQCVRSFLPALSADDVLRSDADLQSLGLDSLAVVSLLLEIESLYDVTFPDELLTFETFATPTALWGTVQTLRPSVQS
jgi:acyl carrier protein